MEKSINETTLSSLKLFIRNSKIILACNTAHLIVGKLDKVFRDQLISLIDVTLTKIHKQGYKNIGLIASPSTVKSYLYGDGVLVLSKTEQIGTEKMIRSVIKGGRVDVTELKVQVDKLRKQGADIVILGCTELSYIASKEKLEGTIDPVEEVIKVALSTRVNI